MLNGAKCVAALLATQAWIEFFFKLALFGSTTSIWIENEQGHRFIKYHAVKVTNSAKI